MTAKFMDSFDHYGDLTLKWYSSSGASIISRTGRFGTDGCSLASDGYLMYYRPNQTVGWADVYENAPSWVAGLAYRATVNEAGSLMSFCLTTGIATAQVVVGINLDGSLYASSGSSTLVTTSRKMTAGNWYYIEAKVVCDASNGSAVIHINGTEWGNISGVATRPYDDASYHYINAVQINGVGAPYIDDIYILVVNGNDPQGSGYNNDFWGDTRIEVMHPISDGTRQDWTPSSGSFGWKMVDSFQPQYTNNVYTYPVYQKETFNMDSNVALPGAMNAIQQSLLIKQSSWSEPLIYTAGADYFLTSGSRVAFPPNTTPTYGRAVWQRYPVALAPWDNVNVLLAEWGLMSTTTSGSL